jgi:serine/threonine protein kinase
MIQHPCSSLEESQQTLSNFDEFRSISQIGRGSFGQILKIERVCDGQCFAMKTEPKNRFVKTLEFEHGVMLKLPKSYYFPKLLCFVETPTHKCLIMELLGNSIQYLLDKTKHKKFSFSTSIRFAIHQLTSIKNLHKIGFIHCDIKTSNFLIRNSNKHPIVLN